MFKNLSFRSDGAFWPGAEHQAETGSAAPRGFFARAVAAIAGEVRARRAARMLASLDDRMLRDIGINRDQAWYAARHGRESMRRAIDRGSDYTRWT